MIDLCTYNEIIDSIPIPLNDRMPELGAAIHAALAAGSKVLDIYNAQDSEKEVREKEDGSPITKADITSHIILTKKLSATGHAILSEEGQQNEKARPNVIWIIDPLDGTSDFVDKTGEFTIMVALVRSGRPIIGVISWPTEHTIFVAQEGMGAYRHTAIEGWKKITVSETSDIAQCIMVGSRHHFSDAEKSFVKRLGVKKFTSMGSSLKACMIASGKAEVYVTITDKIKEWDTAASHIIIAEAGGKMTDARGQNIPYNCKDVHHRYGITITNGAIHDYIIEKLASRVITQSDSNY